MSRLSSDLIFSRLKRLTNSGVGMGGRVKRSCLESSLVKRRQHFLICDARCLMTLISLRDGILWWELCGNSLAGPVLRPTNNISAQSAVSRFTVSSVLAPASFALLNFRLQERRL